MTTRKRLRDLEAATASMSPELCTCFHAVEIVDAKDEPAELPERCEHCGKPFPPGVLRLIVIADCESGNGGEVPS